MYQCFPKSEFVINYQRVGWRIYIADVEKPCEFSLDYHTYYRRCQAWNNENKAAERLQGHSPSLATLPFVAMLHIQCLDDSPLMAFIYVPFAWNIRFGTTWSGGVCRLFVSIWSPSRCLFCLVGVQTGPYLMFSLQTVRLDFWIFGVKCLYDVWDSKNP